jgi:photosystem II stability/assembly factor-like uncharacterized protein
MKQRICLAVTAAVLAPLSVTAAASKPVYSWRTVPWGGGGYVDGMVYHPKVKNLLYARTDVGGVYRYDFTGRRWIPLLDALSHADRDMNGVLSVALDPNDPNKLYLACGLYLGDWAHNGAIMRSDDQGETWAKTDLPFKLGGNADGRGTGERLQVDPNSGNILFLGSNLNGLWKSSDGAKSLAKVGSFPGSNVTLVLFDPNSGAKGSASQTIYVGSGEAARGLYVSHDGGATFELVRGIQRQPPQHAAIGPDGFLYVTFAAGDGKTKNELNPSNVVKGSVWKMELKTGKWQEITPIRPTPGGPTFGYSGIDVDPAHPGTIVTSTIDRWWPEPDEIFLSRDGGLHWLMLTSVSQHDNSRFPWLQRDGQVTEPGKDRMGSWISDVKINPFNPNEMIYGTGGGVWMTHNLTAAGSGQRVKFDFADDNLEETAVTSMVSPPQGATLLATMGDVGGGAWDDLTRPPPASGLFSPNATHQSVDVAWLNPSFLARSTDAKPYGYYSEDGGQHWTAFPSAPPFSPQDAKGNWRPIGPLAVSAGGTSILWSIPREKAYVSFDKGKSWTASSGWPSVSDATLVPVADRSVNGVFYTHDRAGGQILISTDGGRNFAPVIKGIPPVPSWQGTQLAVVPGRMRDLWLAGPFGLLHSADATKPLAALKTVEEAWYVGFGKAPPGRTYPAVYLSGKIKGQTGIWRSDDEGQSWVRINDDIHRFGDGGIVTGDPTEYGTVYVSRAAGGIIVGRPAQ